MHVCRSTCISAASVGTHGLSRWSCPTVPQTRTNMARVVDRRILADPEPELEQHDASDVNELLRAALQIPVLPQIGAERPCKAPGATLRSGQKGRAACFVCHTLPIHCQSRMTSLDTLSLIKA